MAGISLGLGFRPQVLSVSRSILRPSTHPAPIERRAAIREKNTAEPKKISFESIRARQAPSETASPNVSKRFISLGKTFAKKYVTPKEKKTLSEKWTRFVKKKKPSMRPNILTKEKILELCNQLGEEYSVSPILLQAFIQQESGGNANAVGRVLEMGLVQIRPEKMADVKALGLELTNPFDPEQNLRALCVLLYDYQESANHVTVKVKKGNDYEFPSYQRVYFFNGKKYSFSQLPEEIQIQILSLIHNRGVSGTYSGSSIGGSHYDVQKILYDSRGNVHLYARGILEKYHKNKK